MYLAAEAGLAELAGLTKLTELADLAETEDPPPPPPEDQWHDYIWLSSSNRWSACRRDLKWQNMTT
jgi:hypothetical protein